MVRYRKNSSNICGNIEIDEILAAYRIASRSAQKALPVSGTYDGRDTASIEGVALHNHDGSPGTRNVISPWAPAVPGMAGSPARTRNRCRGHGDVARAAFREGAPQQRDSLFLLARAGRRELPSVPGTTPESTCRRPVRRSARCARLRSNARASDRGRRQSPRAPAPAWSCDNLPTRSVRTILSSVDDLRDVGHRVLRQARRSSPSAGRSPGRRPIRDCWSAGRTPLSR